MIFQNKHDLKRYISKFTTKYSLAGLDVGARYVGVATYNSLVKVVIPQTRFDLKKYSITDITDYLLAKNIDAIVVGLPILTNGQESEMTMQVKNFVNKLLEIHDFPICFIDERFTSKQAHTMLKMHNIKRKERDKLDDQISAQLLLEQFIS